MIEIERHIIALTDREVEAALVFGVLREQGKDARDARQMVEEIYAYDDLNLDFYDWLEKGSPRRLLRNVCAVAFEAGEDETVEEFGDRWDISYVDTSGCVTGDEDWGS